MALIGEQGQRWREAWGVYLWGNIAARRPPSDVSMALHREALALATELSMFPLLAHCQLGLGRLYWRTGDHPKAEEHLTTATTMYREMIYWLEKVEAELRGAPS
jgi:tetratricopeptide repeat protein